MAAEMSSYNKADFVHFFPILLKIPGVRADLQSWKPRSFGGIHVDLGGKD